MARAEAGRAGRTAGGGSERQPGAARAKQDRRQDAGPRPLPRPDSVRDGPRGAQPRTAGRQGAARSRERAETRGEPGRWRGLWRNGRLAALLSSLVLVGTLAYLLNAAAFTVQRIEVSGARSSDQQQVLATAGVRGHNIFTVEPQEVAGRLAALPTVREAEVWAELPDRLVVRLVERQPLLIWQVNGARYTIDADGYVITDQPTEEQLRDLVTVRVAGSDPPQVGGRLEGDDVRTVVGMLRRLSQEPLFPLTGVEYAPRPGLVLRGEGGWRLILGDDARLEEKVAVAAALLQGERRWQTLDVTDPDRPVYR